MVANFQVLQPKTPTFCKSFACGRGAVSTSNLEQRNFSLLLLFCPISLPICNPVVPFLWFCLHFHSRGVAGFEFSPLLVAFVLLVLVEFAQLVGGVLLNKPFHCFLFAVFSSCIVFVFPATTLQHFNKTWFLRFVTSTMLWVSNKYVFHSRVVEGLCFPRCRWFTWRLSVTLAPIALKKFLQIAVCFGGSLVCVERAVAKCSKMQF